jgi:hypothetical protein
VLEEIHRAYHFERSLRVGESVRIPGLVSDEPGGVVGAGNLKALERTIESRNFEPMPRQLVRQESGSAAYIKDPRRAARKGTANLFDNPGISCFGFGAQQRNWIILRSVPSVAQPIVKLVIYSIVGLSN